MTAPLACWRCEEPGHGYTECRRPWPESRKERDNRNDRHVQRWQAGAITVEMKRQFIAAENRDYLKARKAA